jgi:hypothetical protein
MSLVQIAPSDLVLRVASATVGASEVPAGSNKGPFVEACLASVDLAPGNPWCAAFVYRMGTKALGALWPLPKTGGCQFLYEWATKANAVHEKPQAGDVFLIWETALGRFGHTGFVLTVKPDGSCVTIEGNTNAGGSREGYIVAEKTRLFSLRDRFIGWAQLVKE